MKRALVLLFLLPILAHAELSKTYPSAPVTTIRMDAYIDEASTIYKSTWMVNKGTWTFFGSTRTFLNGNNHVFGRISLDGSTTTVKQSSWTLTDYNTMLLDETKQRWINEVMDHDIEQYMVWVDSNCPVGWKGWASKMINGVVVPIPCQ